MSYQRTTLGSISNKQSSLGAPSVARKSMNASGANRMSMAGARKSIGGRQASLGRKSQGARTSTIGNTGTTSHASGPRSDPRPITDKGFMNASIRSLLNYLITHNYDSTISPKILARPSSKDFNNIVTFLLRMVDTNFNNGTMKFEDEVSLAFKSLGYPFNISKTALYAVGSPHTWPGLLAAITWLIELLTYDEEVSATRQLEAEEANNPDPNSNEEEDLEKLGQNSDKAFFSYLGEAYTSFLSGDDNTYTALEEDLVQNFEAGNVGVERELARLADENEALTGENDELTKMSSSLPELEKREAELQSDLAKFHKLIEQLNQHKETLQQKVEARTEELSKNEAELQSLAASVDSLKTQVSTQELSADDVRRLQGERARLEEGLERATAMKAQHNKAFFDQEAQLTTVLNEIDANVAQYNAKCAALHLIPETAKNAAGVKFHLSLNKSAATNDDQTALLGNVDIVGTIKPAVENLKSCVVAATSEARQELLNLLDMEESSEEKLSDMIDEQKNAGMKAKKLEDTYNREKEQIDAALAAIVEETEATESKIASLKDPVALESALARSQTKLNQLKALREEKASSHQASKKAVHDEILEALAMVADHHSYCAKRFGEVKALSAKVMGGIDAKSKAVMESAAEKAMPPVPPS